MVTAPLIISSTASLLLAASLVVTLFMHFRRPRVRVHIAQDLNRGTGQLTGERKVFINVANLGGRPATITHTWIRPRATPRDLDPERRLPKTLQPSESWEISTPLSRFPDPSDEDGAMRSVVVRLTSGKELRSKPNRNVPPYGWMPGGDPS